MMSTNGIRHRRIRPQNVAKRLIERETFGVKRPGTHFHIARQFYQNVFPNFTVVNVEKPPCFLRKFSPDGKYFIAFSADQTSLEVYTYNGAAAAGDLLQGVPGEYIANKSEGKCYDVRSKIFECFFKLKFSINVCEGQKQLNRECSLFTEDGRYVIIGSAAYIPEDLRPHFYQIYTNNESVCPNPRSPLEDYSLHIVDLHAGRLCGSLHFKVDKIFLSHNQGLYLYKDILAVLSVQHQIIHIYQVLDGMFLEVRKIGRFCFEDDLYIINSVISTEGERPFREPQINSLKHRLLVFLYRRAATISKSEKNPYELRRFYQFFENFKNLRLWKMQLLDENHLLIKYANDEVVTLKATEPNSQISYFVVYNMTEGKILAVFDNTTQELLSLFEDYCDPFRNSEIHTQSQFTCSPSNNHYARLIQQRFKQTIISAKFGGKMEATRRLLAQLPISAQSYSSSPYLDLSLFSYDDKWVSGLERPKACGEHPIRFYSRDAGLLKFRIYAGVLGRSVPATARRLVAFTFHPTDPFAISVQRTNAEYIVNFHICHSWY